MIGMPVDRDRKRCMHRCTKLTGMLSTVETLRNVLYLEILHEDM